MKQLLWAVVALLGWTGSAEAKCGWPGLELIWSYPASGDMDVPTNAELWAVVPYAWWNPVVRLDGREVSYAMSPDRGVVHVVPDTLLANQEHVLQLDFTSVRSGEDAGANAVMEIAFRTGETTVVPPDAPQLGAHRVSEALYVPAVTGNCPEVILAQECLDTGPNTLHSFEPRGAAPLAWLMGEHVLPARCGAPQTLTHFYEHGGACIPVRAIGAGGLLSEATLACIPNDQPREPDAGVARASDGVDADPLDQTADVRANSGCSTAPRNGHLEGFPLLLAFLYRRRRER